MTETLILLAGALLLAVSVATLVVAGRTLRAAREYVDLAEERLERLREDQARLTDLIEDQRRAAEKAREEAVPEVVRTRQGAERSIERTKQDLLGRIEAPRPPAQTPVVPEEPPRTGKTPPPAGLPETRSKAAKPPKEEPPRRAVVRPHPDDDVRPGGPPAGRTGAPGTSPTRMFRVFYDRYLDNYEGYVKLAERLHAMRTDDEKVPGSGAERDWQERLRRVNDGIERTTARLDILEHSNPELASDDRVSRRAAISRGHARFAR